MQLSSKSQQVQMASTGPRLLNLTPGKFLTSHKTALMKCWAKGVVLKKWGDEVMQFGECQTFN